MSDVSPDCEVIPLESNLPGWWAKLELFKQEGPVLYLDLDTAIVGSCDHWLEAIKDQEFVILRDFYRGAYNKLAMGSGLMYWSENMRWVWETAQMGKPQDSAPCDQSYLESLFFGKRRAAYFQDFTDDVLSYKAHVLNGHDWRAASVVCFHGKPRPWEQRTIPWE